MAARAAVGIALLAAPRHAVTLYGGSAEDRRLRITVRILGIRQVAQATISAGWPTPKVLALGAVTDVVHAGSMLGVALASRQYRRPALRECGVAVALAAMDAQRRSRRLL